MDNLLTLLCSLLVGAAVSHVHAGLLPAQAYWYSALPNTAMPSALIDLLAPGTLLDLKTSTSVNVGKPGNTGVNVGPDGVGAHVQPKYGKPPVMVGYPRTPFGHIFIYRSPFNYLYDATENQIRDDRRVAYFFLERDLHPGSKRNLQFSKTNKGVELLSQSEAEEIPFSSKKFPEIIERFSIKPASIEETVMKETLEECEGPAVKGEKKICATSLESMVDFTVASLGTKDIKSVSTTLYGNDDTSRQEYTIISNGIRTIAEDQLVACHQQSYTYVVYYCHLAKSTKGYIVKMIGKDGVLVDAVAVCHSDTSSWNPKHAAFRFLKVKPGTVPVCHFLPQDHVLFARNG